jgi:hypothetical protein
MASDTKPNGTIKAPELGSPDAAIQAMTLLFGDNVRQLAGTAESQQVAILALTSLVALLPGVAQVDANRLAVIVQALTENRKDGEQVRERIATYAAMVVGLANKLPEVMAEVDAKTKGH